jgi:hypothetical protein
MLGSCGEHNTPREQIKNNESEYSQRGASTLPQKSAGKGCFECDKVITVQRFSPV